MDNNTRKNKRDLERKKKMHQKNGDFVWQHSEMGNF